MNTALESRYPLWFDNKIGFVGSSNEKVATSDTINALLQKISSKDSATRPVLQCKGDTLTLADLGCAAGVLGKMVGKSLHEQFGKKIEYTGIDVNENMKNVVEQVVTGDAFQSVHFLHGSAEQLTHCKPDILLASHIYYYPDNEIPKPGTQPHTPLDKALRDSLLHLKHDGLALIVHESKSDVDPIKRKFAVHVEGDTTDRLKKMIVPAETVGASIIEFDSHIYFPELSDEQWNKLKCADYYDTQTNPYGDDKALLNARILAEFFIHKPLENMEVNERLEYLDELKKIVSRCELSVSEEATRDIGQVRVITNTNQLIIRPHHRNKSACEFIKNLTAELSQNTAMAM
jgi:hypothetical protein